MSRILQYRKCKKQGYKSSKKAVKTTKVEEKIQLKEGRHSISKCIQIKLCCLSKKKIYSATMYRVITVYFHLPR